MRVVITGALGHIGSELIGQLDKDDEILAIDNLSSNHHSVLFRGNLSRPIRFVEDDILYADLKSLFAGSDTVIHLAAITDAAHSHLHKDEVEAVNFEGAVKVGRACAELGIPMIFPSSTSVYGVSEGVVDEEGLVRPQSPYAWSKLNAERSLQSIANLRVSIMRFGTIYGLSIGGRFHTAVNSFAWNAALNKPIEVWKTAWGQERPYLWIEDAVGAIKHVMAKNLFDNQVYNVVTGNHTVAEIVGEIQKHRPTLKVNVVDSPLMNQLSYSVDCSKFKNTGWFPMGKLQLGIMQEMGWLSWIN
jgi:UDP-glucose 4-epimerase